MAKKEVPNEQSCSSRGNLANTAVCVVSITSELSVVRFATIAFLFVIGNRYFGRSFVRFRKETQSAHSATAVCPLNRLALERWDQKYCRHDVEDIDRRKQGDGNVKRLFDGVLVQQAH